MQQENSQITMAGRRCDQCELFFQPKTSSQLYCPNCMSGKPFANQIVDHIYLNSLQNTDSAKSQDSTKSCGVLTNKKDLPPKRQAPDQSCAEISNNKKSRLHTNGVMILPKQVASMVETKPDKKLSRDRPQWKNNYTNVTNNSSLKIVESNNIPDVIDLSSDDEEEYLNQERPISNSFMINVKKEIAEGPLSVSSLSEKKEPIVTKMTNMEPEINRNTLETNSAENETSIDNTDISADPDECRSRSTFSLVAISPIKSDKSCELASQNSQLVLWNQESDHASLERLKERENELNQMIRSYSFEPDVDAAAASDVHKRISELKSQRVTDLETITKKEAIIKSLNLQVDRLQAVIDACKKERDCLHLNVKNFEDVVNRARLASDNLEEQIIGARRELSAADDPELVRLLSLTLKNKEKRLVASKGEVTRSIGLFKEAKEDFQEVEEELKAKEVDRQELLDQSEKEKCELSSLYRKYASIEQDITIYDSQLSNLEDKRNEKIEKIFELEDQLLVIEYQKKKKALDIRKQTICRMLSLKRPT